VHGQIVYTVTVSNIVCFKHIWNLAESLEDRRCTVVVSIILNETEQDNSLVPLLLTSIVFYSGSLLTLLVVLVLHDRNTLMLHRLR
jgi:hypothetical protein